MKIYFRRRTFLNSFLEVEQEYYFTYLILFMFGLVFSFYSYRISLVFMFINLLFFLLSFGIVLVEHIFTEKNEIEVFNYDKKKYKKIIPTIYEILELKPNCYFKYEKGKIHVLSKLQYEIEMRSLR